MVHVRRIDHVSPKGEEADDQAEDQLGNRARRLEEYGQADDGQLAHAPAGREQRGRWTKDGGEDETHEGDGRATAPAGVLDDLKVVGAQLVFLRRGSYVGLVRAAARRSKEQNVCGYTPGFETLRGYSPV